MPTFIQKAIKFIKQPEYNYKNAGFLKYHFLKALHKILLKSGVVKSPYQSRDMFNWSLYHIHYKAELKEGLKVNTMILKPGDYIFQDEKLLKNNPGILPLCENHRLLYETVMQLKPGSLFELGCGNGIHLNNLQTLMPEVKLSGIDLLEKQIEFLHQTYPNLNADIKQADATKPFAKDFMPKADLVFSQAVIMHIHTGESHKQALANMFNLADKYVVLMEKWQNHNYLEDIKEIQAKKMIDWEKIYFYYKNSDETGKPHIMICSKFPLNYLEVKDYNVYLNN